MLTWSRRTKHDRATLGESDKARGIPEDPVSEQITAMKNVGEITESKKEFYKLRKYTKKMFV